MCGARNQSTHVSALRIRVTGAQCSLVRVLRIRVPKHILGVRVPVCTHRESKIGVSGAWCGLEHGPIIRVLVCAQQETEFPCACGENQSTHAQCCLAHVPRNISLCAPIVRVPMCAQQETFSLPAHAKNQSHWCSVQLRAAPIISLRANNLCVCSKEQSPHWGTLRIKVTGARWSLQCAC